LSFTGFNGVAIDSIFAPLNKHDVSVFWSRVDSMHKLQVTIPTSGVSGKLFELFSGCSPCLYAFVISARHTIDVVESERLVIIIGAQQGCLVDRVPGRQIIVAFFIGLLGESSDLDRRITQILIAIEIHYLGIRHDIYVVIVHCRSRGVTVDTPCPSNVT